MTRQPKKKTPRSKRVFVSITPDEWVQIKAKAAEAGISASDLFRASALGKKINSNIDLEAIQFLTKLSGVFGVSTLETILGFRLEEGFGLIVVT